MQSESGQMSLMIDVEEVVANFKRVFTQMRQAFLNNSNPSWAERYNRLERLENLLLENRAQIQAAIETDFGCRSAFLTDMADILPTLSEIRLLKAKGERWMKPKRVLADFYFWPASNRLIPQPKGVVGIVVPWNYPLQLAFEPVADAFAAGNRCMVKLSEFTPNFATLISELAEKYFLADELCIVIGDEVISSRFCDLPFDHLFFTGSTRVGRLVAQAAGKNLTPITLELGGKSPVIVTPDYPLEQAAERIMVGKLLNAGQTCIAPDYVLIERSRIPHFVQACQSVVTRLYPEGFNSPDYASVISVKHFDRLVGLLDQLPEESRAISLFAEAASHAETRKIAPHLVLNPPFSEPIMLEEIFGPILPIVSYRDDHLEEAVEFVKARAHPLALYWFDEDKKRTEEAARKLIAGGLCINDTLFHAVQSGIPFGGIGPSGMGNYHGKAGFETFSHMKPVFKQSRHSLVSKANPPYSAKFRSILNIVIEKGGKFLPF